MEPILAPKGGMKDLVRNPLGIVALFISLIYGFANLLLGATVSALTAQERYPLIIFIVLFPVIVLCVFYRLVSKHHGKLYAPGDYKDDKSFLRTLSAEERQERLEQDVAESLPDPALAEGLPVAIASSVVVEGGAIPTAAASSALKAERTFSTTKMAHLYSETRNVESAALAELEREFGPAEARDIAIADTGVSFDAVLKKTDEKLIFAEIKVLRAPLRSPSMLDRVLYNALLADKYFNGRFKLILLVVYRFDSSELPRIEKDWRRRVERCPADVDLRFMPFPDVELNSWFPG